ncbi:MAG: right-handed parallel beta-helix repeat-containing protein [Candidatus Marinimicrobia bacterium]|nr:right-handed parallel beta-helix repeat-containing protein [Candidatus Neomarinimicrobiota bacterium]
MNKTACFTLLALLVRMPCVFATDINLALLESGGIVHVNAGAAVQVSGTVYGGDPLLFMFDDTLDFKTRLRSASGELIQVDRTWPHITEINRIELETDGILAVDFKIYYTDLRTGLWVELLSVQGNTNRYWETSPAFLPTATKGVRLEIITPYGSYTHVKEFRCWGQYLETNLGLLKSGGVDHVNAGSVTQAMGTVYGGDPLTYMLDDDLDTKTRLRSLNGGVIQVDRTWPQLVTIQGISLQTDTKVAREFKFYYFNTLAEDWVEHIWVPTNASSVWTSPVDMAPITTDKIRFEVIRTSTDESPYTHVKELGYWGNYLDPELGLRPEARAIFTNNLTHSQQLCAIKSLQAGGQESVGPRHPTPEEQALMAGPTNVTPVQLYPLPPGDGSEQNPFVDALSDFLATNPQRPMKLMVPPGYYEENNLQLGSNVWLIAQGIVIIKPSVAVLDNLSTAQPTVSLDSGSGLIGLELAGHSHSNALGIYVAAGAQDVVIAQNIVRDMGHNGITGGHAQSVYVLENYVENIGRSGIRCLSGWIVKNNMVCDAGVTRPGGDDGIITSARTLDALVLNNLVVSTRAPEGRHAIATQASTNVVIQGNLCLVEGYLRGGIVLADYSNDNIVSGNVVINDPVGTQLGIHVFGKRNLFTGNAVVGSEYGLSQKVDAYVEGNVFEFNYLEADIGIQDVDPQVNWVGDNLIVNNNMAQLSAGGTCAASGTGWILTGNSLADAFDGDPATMTRCNIGSSYWLNIDRCWEEEMVIREVGMLTTASQMGYEYSFFYWDADTSDWEILVTVTNGATSHPKHVLAEPVVTTKIRLWIEKAGSGGTGTYFHVYDFRYRGEPLATY